jgi:hypothetical protein
MTEKAYLLDDSEVRQILWEVEGEDRPEWKDTADRCPAYKTCRPRWNRVDIRDGVPVRFW